MKKIIFLIACSAVSLHGFNVDALLQCRKAFASRLPQKKDAHDAVRFSPCIHSIISKVCSIDSKLDQVEGVCAPQQIRQSDITSPFGYIIIEPGHYCVSENLTAISAGDAIITISASDVLLDLNGHELLVSTSGFGIFVPGQLFGQKNVSDIVIQNGFIVSNSLNSTGMLISANNVQLNSIECTQLGFGCAIGDSHNVSMQDCMMSTNTLNVIVGGSNTVSIKSLQANNGFISLVEGSTNVTIHDSEFNNNFGPGLVLDESSNITIDSCECNDNNVLNIMSFPGLVCSHCNNVTFKNSSFSRSEEYPFNVQESHQFVGIGFNDCENVTIQSCIANNNVWVGFVGELKSARFLNCVASGNGSQGGLFNTGFFLIDEDNEDILLQNCFACANFINGFQVSGNNICLIECEAKDNGNAGVGSGFVFTGTGLIKECIAAGNAQCGFLDEDGDSNFKLVANTGQGNGDSPAPLDSSTMEMFDTNYCTSYMDPGPGVASSNAGLPYKQSNPLSPNTPTPFFGYWNNVTMP